MQIKSESSKMVEPPTRMKMFSSLFWWDIEPEQLARQVEGYQTLRFYKRARGISALLCLLAASLTLAVNYSTLQLTSLYDVLPFLVLGIFIYLGHRWSMVGAMVFWTFEKGYAIVESLPKFSFLQIVWWTIFMHQFWLAFKVEAARRNPALLLDQPKPDGSNVYAKEQALWYGDGEAAMNSAESNETQPSLVQPATD